jgi:hypothetical protein
MVGLEVGENVTVLEAVSELDVDLVDDCDELELPVPDTESDGDAVREAEPVVVAEDVTVIVTVGVHDTLPVDVAEAVAVIVVEPVVVGVLEVDGLADGLARAYR